MLKKLTLRLNDTTKDKIGFMFFKFKFHVKQFFCPHRWNPKHPWDFVRNYYRTKIFFICPNCDHEEICEATKEVRECTN